jgi:hypothetical protein
MHRRFSLAVALCALGSAFACGGDRRAAGVSAADTQAAYPSGLENAADGSVPAVVLPPDIAIPEGLRATSVSTQQPGAVIALFTGDLAPDEVAVGFESSLRAQGWTIDSAREGGSEVGLLARKQGRIATVVATRLSGKLHVELGVFAPQN